MVLASMWGWIIWYLQWRFHQHSRAEICAVNNERRQRRKKRGDKQRGTKKDLSVASPHLMDTTVLESIGQFWRTVCGFSLGYTWQLPAGSVTLLIGEQTAWSRSSNGSKDRIESVNTYDSPQPLDMPDRCKITQIQDIPHPQISTDVLNSSRIHAIDLTDEITTQQRQRKASCCYATYSCSIGLIIVCTTLKLDRTVP